MTERKNESFLGNIGYMLGMIWKGDKGTVIFTMYKNISEQVFYVYFAVYMMKYIYNCIENRGSYEELLLMIGIACLLHIVVHIVSASHAYYLKVRTPNVYRYIYNKIMDKSGDIELAKFEQPEFYDKYSRALDECLNRSMELLNTLSFFIGFALSAIGGIILIIQLDFVLVLFIIPAVICSFILGKIRAKKLYKLEMECTRDKRVADYTKRVFYEKKYASELRLYDIKNVLFSRHKESYNSLYDRNVKYRRKVMLYDFLRNSMMYVFAYFAGFIYSAIVVKSFHPELAASYVVLADAIGFVSWNLMETINQGIELPKHNLFIQNLRDFFDTSNEKIKTDYLPIPKDVESIEFKNVSYTYSGATVPTIVNLSLKIGKHERIAFVGHNGAGKTTLIKLLMGLYEVTEGEILLNGININKFNKKDYFEIFGTVFQDLQIFALPISHNVLMREPKNEAERELVKEALIKAQFGDKLAELPKGIDTMVTREFDSEGAVLSGGQSQKLAIARVFAKNPEVVVLDEPSSALDPIAEYNMYKNMNEASEHKTVVFISHRLSSARVADKIYMFENGTIVESGSHDELMEKNGKYADMFRLQAKNYQESLPTEMVV